MGRLGDLELCIPSGKAKSKNLQGSVLLCDVGRGDFLTMN